MEPCEACGAVSATDADGYISLRRPVGIPDEVMPQVVAAIYADLLLTAAIYAGRGAVEAPDLKLR